MRLLMSVISGFPVAAEDIEAVFDQDPQRVCILQGPVAAKWSMVKDEPVKDLPASKYGGDVSAVPTRLPCSPE
jgi:fatty acid synthase subunit alpha